MRGQSGQLYLNVLEKLHFMYLLDFQFRSADDWLGVFGNGVDLRSGNGQSLLGVGCLNELDGVYNLASKLKGVR